MAGVPKAKITDVGARFDRLIGDFTETLDMNDFAFRRLEAELQEFLAMPEFEAEARIYLGHLYSFKLDEPGFRHNFERSRKLSGKTDNWRISFISAALNFGFLYEAKAEIDAPWDFSDISNVRNVRGMMISCGLFESAAILTRTLERMKVDARHTNKASKEYLYDEIFYADEVIKQANVSELFVLESINIASRVIVERVNKPLHRYALSVSPDAGIQYSFAVNDSAEILVEHDWAIAEALVDTLEDPKSNVLSLITRPLRD